MLKPSENSQNIQQSPTHQQIHPSALATVYVFSLSLSQECTALDKQPLICSYTCSTTQPPIALYIHLIWEYFDPKRIVGNALIDFPLTVVR